MARIPVREPRVDISGVPQNQVDTSQFAASGKTFSQIADTMTELTGDFKKIRDSRETAKAAADFQIGLAQTRAQAQDDPDFYNTQKYEDAINQLSDDKLQTISDPLIREEYRQKFRITGYATYTDISKVLRNRQVEDAKYQGLRGLEADRTSYLSFVDGAQRETVKANANDKIENMFQSQILTAEQAAALRKDVNEDWEKEWITNQYKGTIINDPSWSLAELTKGNGGYFGKASESERSQLRSLAQQKVAEQKHQIVVAQTQRERQIVDQLLNPPTDMSVEPITFETLNRDETAGVITTGFKESVEVFMSTAPAVKTNEASYLGIMSEILMGQGTASDTMNAILTSPDISREDKRHLLNMNYGDGVDSVLKSALEEAETKRRSMVYKDSFKMKALKMVYSQTSMNPAAQYWVVNEMARERIKTGGENFPWMDAAKKKLAERRLIDHPEYANYPPDGMYGYDSLTGQVVKMYPNGARVVVTDMKGNRTAPQQRKQE